MLLPAIILDSSMTSREVIARLTSHGFWKSPEHPGSREIIEQRARRLNLSFDETELRLRRDPFDERVAIRRQWGTQILWYSLTVTDVLDQADADQNNVSLLDFMGLHESDSGPPLIVDEDGRIPFGDGVVLMGSHPIGVNATHTGAFATPPAQSASPPQSATQDPGGTPRSARPAAPMSPPVSAPPPSDRKSSKRGDGLGGLLGSLLGGGKTSRGDGGLGGLLGGLLGGGGDGGGAGGEGSSEEIERSEPAARAGGSRDPESARASAPASEPAGSQQPVTAWPKIDSPSYMPARTPFTLIVGLAETEQGGVTGAQVTLLAPAEAKSVTITIELIADGIDALNGWSQPLEILVANPTLNVATFDLIGLDPTGSEALQLTTLQIRYVLNGAVCGSASKPMAIGQFDTPELMRGAPPFGTSWLDQAPTASAVELVADNFPADLTIEIAKPDGNAANGRYECRLFSPHALPHGSGPFPIDLGQDSKTFAEAVVRDIRNWSTDPLIDNIMRSCADVIGGKLPPEVHDTIRSVSNVGLGRPPAILLVSADPYVPWELALVDPPIDPTRPPYLGAQVILGRWLRDDESVRSRTIANFRPPRPPVQPVSSISVKNMAVMAGMYKATSGLRKLPEAEGEATTLAGAYDAVQLAATSSDIKRLLDAGLTHKFEDIGGVEAIHFAGHGTLDPSIADGSMLMLSEGVALPSILFRSAKYGGEHQPLFFLNACMIGIGGALLGDMGGFPGNCLRGGFGGVLGALWEIDDKDARTFATEFWEQALPVDGSAARPVGEVLRDLRANYDPTASVPAHTWLAYVYYGHPRLTLKRTA